MLLLTGSRDRTVLPRNTAVLAARLAPAWRHCGDQGLPKLGHIGIILALLPYLRWRAPVLADIVDSARLAGPAPTPRRIPQPRHPC